MLRRFGVLLPADLDIAVVPVFAREFDSIPDEGWNANAFEDWRIPLGRVRAAITHTSYAVDAIRSAMGADYPVWSIPAPVYDCSVGIGASASPVRANSTLLIGGGVAIDTHAVDLSLFEPGRAFTDGARAIGLLRRAMAAPDCASQRSRSTASSTARSSIRRTVASIGMISSPPSSGPFAIASTRR